AGECVRGIGRHDEDAVLRTDPVAHAAAAQQVAREGRVFEGEEGVEVGGLRGAKAKSVRRLCGHGAIVAVVSPIVQTRADCYLARRACASKIQASVTLQKGLTLLLDPAENSSR